MGQKGQHAPDPADEAREPLTEARGIYSIGAVARMLGVAQATIRSWEDRYGRVVAERNHGGRRLYTTGQLGELRFVKDRIDEGLSAADAHRLLAERQAGQLHTVPQPLPASGTRPLILLAESERNAAQIHEFFLREEGYDVQVALSAQDAEEEFSARNPALTILELTISGGIGPQLCERLKRRSAAPVVAISSIDHRASALAAGADAFLQKPLEPLQVVSTVNSLLGEQRAGPRTAVRRA